MPIAIIGGLVGGAASAAAGVATIAGAAISASAKNKAANAAAKATADSNALQADIYAKNSANLSPYSTLGLKAGNELSGLFQLGGDPAASKLAFDNFLKSTGYQFQLDQGLKAVSAQRATAGALNSGSTLKALSNYGQNTALGYLNDYAGGLQDLEHTGAGAASALAGVGQNYASAVSTNNQNAATTAANAAAANSKDINSLLGAGLSALGVLRGNSSY